MSNDQGVFKWDANNVASNGGFSSGGIAITPEYIDLNNDGLGSQMMHISTLGSDASGSIKTPEMYSPNNDNYGHQKAYVEYFGEDVNNQPKNH